MEATKVKKKIALTLAGIVLATCTFAQSAAYYSKNEYLTRAIDLYEKEMYRSAQKQLSSAESKLSHIDEVAPVGIEFYEAMCALKIKQPNAEALAEEVLNRVPHTERYSTAAYEYAKYLYDKERFKDAKKWFAEVKSSDVPAKEQAEYAFKAGYSYYRTGEKGDKATATNFFRKAKEQRGPYGDASLYYYSHIEYENGNYATAAKGFERLRSNPNYASVVPYYTMQIAFIQKDYDKVIEEGVDFMKFASDKRKGEIARLVSEAYLYKGDAAKSLAFFKEFEGTNKGKQLLREEKYLKAHILYKNKQYEDAITALKGIDATNDSITQVRNYYLADCYLQTNNKPAALKAFADASKLKFDKEIAENSAFNYAKLAIELNNDDKPVNEYLKNYPKSANGNELKSFFAESEAKRGNYSEALDILQSINSPSPADKNAIQRISYAYGLNLLKNKKYGEAVQMFDYSQKYSQYNNSLAAMTKYWKGEASYASQNYDEAERLYEDFINSAGAFKNSQEYKVAHYNIGYSYFKQHDYDNALRWWRKYISFENISTRKTVYLGDSYNRIGDCYFKKRDFQQAIENYTKAESLNLSNSDYSAYQKALTLGFTSTETAKVTALDKMISAYPKSNYIPAALYEMGRTYTQMSKYTEATNAFQKIMTNHKTSPYYPKALVEMGLIQVNQGNNDKALTYYQQVVEKSPDAPEAKDALEGIKSIYIDQNRMDEYFAYANRIGQTVKSSTEKDSLVFTAAEKQYQAGDCDNAATSLRKYLKDFPEAANKTAANFYIADCALRKGNDKDALSGYSYVINQPQSDFTEMAWFGYAKANLNLDNYTKAIEGFEKLKTISQTPSVQLDAEVGCMRAYADAGQFDKALTSATRVAATKDIPEELVEEANFTRARALQSTGKNADAIEPYRKLAKDYKKVADAEAKYHIIEILYDTKKYKDMENEVYSFADNKQANQYWLAKGFIKLGDMYVQQKDYFQAKATYKSITDGYPRKDDGIKDEASKKYTEIESKN